MLKNYFTLAYRNLFKNKVASGINIFGLSVAVACSIVAFLFVHSKTDNEDFQAHGANIFLVLLVIAAVVATPISYFLLNALLDSIYTYRMDVGPMAFALSYGLVFLTAILTISTQIYQLAVANPAETLRNE